ncbi:MAG TPA: M20/M25/M40 family metallo-hydrolase, partial [Kribbella sp.]|nr:M20/M25/M40 family metallo-hydrolase [Kribbella sp.]
TLSDAMLEQLTRDLPALAERIAAAHGCTVDARLSPQYPVTVNDAERTAETTEVLGALFGAERVQHLANPLMGAEDFSMVLREVPGAFTMVGARPDDVTAAEAPSNHSSIVRFDDAVLADNAAALAQLAARHLTPQG